jgi:hypothetical protein
MGREREIAAFLYGGVEKKGSRRSVIGVLVVARPLRYIITDLSEDSN